MTTGREAVVVVEALLPRDLCYPQIQCRVPPRHSHIHHNPIHSIQTSRIHIFETRGQGAEVVGTAIRNTHPPNLLDLHRLK